MPTTKRSANLPGGLTASIKKRTDTPGAHDTWLQLRRKGHWYVVFHFRSYRSAAFKAVSREFALQHGEST